jgi:hypothetical protein
VQGQPPAETASAADLFIPDVVDTSAPQPFEVNAQALRERIRHANGNPYVRGLDFPRVEVSPRDHSWWAGRERRFARLYLSPMDQRTVDYLQELNPLVFRRFVRLLTDLLDVGRVEFLPLDGTRRRPGGTGRAALVSAPRLPHIPTQRQVASKPR